MEVSVLSIYFEFQSAFMNENLATLNTIKDIRQMMERSSRFISLSGLSGVAAGICALIGAWFANDALNDIGGYHDITNIVASESRYSPTLHQFLGERLFIIAVLTFLAAFGSAFFFTWLRSLENKQPIWDATAKRLMINVAIPLVTGGIFLLKLIDEGEFGLIAPGCLVFYGLSLVNASKYTLGEIRYLGYCQIVLGLMNLRYETYSLYFWAVGFGILHIVYGLVMWWKYERTDKKQA